MSHDKDRKLVMMANQIGTFFATQGDELAVSGTADHIRKFWEPRMRNAILAYVDATGGEGLHDNVKAALARLRPKPELAVESSGEDAGT